MACPHSEDQWPNYFQHQTSYPQTSLNTYDSHMMTTDSVVTTSSMSLSPTHSSSPGDRGQGPSTASPKPIRRRSRASKKTPTTLLNADASNFRALVQQFTGRPSPPSVITPGAQRGPVNINFGQSSYSADDQGPVSGSGYSPFGYGANPPHHLQYDQQRYYDSTHDPNGGISENFVGDGLNIDDLDWGTISSSTTHGSGAHHFM